MADQDLRDKSGRLLGKVKTLSDGTLELRNQSGNLMGKYNPKHNETRDNMGSLVGKGNLLMTLL